jgi:hypothetical protein
MISTIKELKDLLKLCRAQGVLEIDLATTEGTVKFKLGDLPQTPSTNTVTDPAETEDKWANFPVGTLTNEQLMFYSSGGDPSQDPENQQ